MISIQAVYENGVFKPLEPIDLPEHWRGRMDLDAEDRKTEAWRDIYTVLNERHPSGEHDTAARHDEHQP